MMKEEQQGLVWRALDPIGGSWLRLPMMPDPIGEGQVGDVVSSTNLWWNPFSASRARWVALLLPYHPTAGKMKRVCGGCAG